MKKKYSWINIISYFFGNYRYVMYHKGFKWLIRKHIIDQYKYRLFVMDMECYYKGSCKLCGCPTTALQFANKACDKPCYPKMMSRKEWNSHKDRAIRILSEKGDA